jgi:hypothetical protein
MALYEVTLHFTAKNGQGHSKVEVDASSEREAIDKAKAKSILLKDDSGWMFQHASVRAIANEEKRRQRNRTQPRNRKS